MVIGGGNYCDFFYSTYLIVIFLKIKCKCNKWLLYYCSTGHRNLWPKLACDHTSLSCLAVINHRLNTHHNNCLLYRTQVPCNFLPILQSCTKECSKQTIKAFKPTPMLPPSIRIHEDHTFIFNVTLTASIKASKPNRIINTQVLSFTSKWEAFN